MYMKRCWRDRRAVLPHAAVTCFPPSFLKLESKKLILVKEEAAKGCLREQRGQLRKLKRHQPQPTWWAVAMSPLGRPNSTWKMAMIPREQAEG